MDTPIKPQDQPANLTSPKHHEVRIIHEGQIKSFSLRHGMGVQALCKRHHTPIEFDCRRADCGICIVTVVTGEDNLSPPTASEADFLKAMRADPDERLACQCRVLGDVTIEVKN
jgi:ferredoxin